MIQVQTALLVADNTGAKKALIIRLGPLRPRMFETLLGQALENLFGMLLALNKTQ